MAKSGISTTLPYESDSPFFFCFSTWYCDECARSLRQSKHCSISLLSITKIKPCNMTRTHHRALRVEWKPTWIRTTITLFTVDADPHLEHREYCYVLFGQSLIGEHCARMVYAPCLSTTRKQCPSHPRTRYRRVDSRWNTFKTFEQLLDGINADIICFQGSLCMSMLAVVQL